MTGASGNDERDFAPQHRGDEPEPEGPRLAPRVARLLGWGTLALVLVLTAALVLPNWIDGPRRDESAPSPSGLAGPTGPSGLSGPTESTDPTADNTVRIIGDPFDSRPLVVRAGGAVIARVWLLEHTQQGTGIRACPGEVPETTPPDCTGFATTGMTWQALTDAGVAVHSSATAGGMNWTDPIAVVGTFDGDTFAVTRVYADPGDAPFPETAPAGSSLNFDAFCTPSRSTITKGTAVAAQAAAEALPDFQFLFASGTTLNVVVTQDVVRARESIEKVYLGPLCVGQGLGLTNRRLSTAQHAVERQLLGKGVTGVRIRPENQGAALEVDVDMLTQDLRDSIIAAVGADVAQWLIIRADVLPVG